MVKFQSTHLHEVWQLSQSFGNFMLTFQSTHLHEVWRAEVITSVSLRCFNPHTYMRCDGGSIWKLSDCECFNPHTYMRCDRMPSFRWHLHICFNPHTYMRCDVKGACIFHQRLVSIHTPTWGVTSIMQICQRTIRFQSTHLHEVWRL